MSQNSKWAAWQQLVLDQVDYIVDAIDEYFEPTKPEPVVENEINPIEAVDLHPITEEESTVGLEEEVITPVKPKKGNKA